MALQAAGSPLVVGSPGVQGATLTVEILKAIMVRGERVEVGTLVEVPLTVANELIHIGRAAKAPPVPVVEPAPEQPAPEPESVEPPVTKTFFKRGKRHA